MILIYIYIYIYIYIGVKSGFDWGGSIVSGLYVKGDLTPVCMYVYIYIYIYIYIHKHKIQQGVANIPQRFWSILTW